MEETGMKQFDYTIKNPVGIHARPGGLLVKEAKVFGNTAITVTKNATVARATSLMQLMGLGTKPGDTVTVKAEGVNEDAAIAAMRKFFLNNL